MKDTQASTGKVLSGKTALVTGGGGALGGASALNLLRDGAAVVLVGRTLASLETAKQRLLKEQPDARIELKAADATNTEQMQAAFQAAYDIQGRLDMVVSIVGRGGGFIPILLHDANSFRSIIEINTVSTFIAVRYSAPLMKNGGAIVCISSTVAKIPFPYMSAYTAGKFAVEGFVKCAADELAAAGIRVNCVRPGLTPAGGTKALFEDKETLAMFQAETPLVASRGGFGAPDDIGRAVRWLCGPESSWVTGQSFAVDGGHELRRYPDISHLVARTYGEAALQAVKKGQAPAKA
jgi:NAD(P)-dependent dehydrogenase (short-subunit alcohol dehydrogenase family)